MMDIEVLEINIFLQSQKVVTAYLKSEQLLPFGIAWQNTAIPTKQQH